MQRWMITGEEFVKVPGLWGTPVCPLPRANPECEDCRDTDEGGKEDSWGGRR